MVGLWIFIDKKVGTIPTEIGTVVSIIGLHLDDNQLSETCPTEIGSLVNTTDTAVEDGALNSDFGVTRRRRRPKLRDRQTSTGGTCVANSTNWTV